MKNLTSKQYEPNVKKENEESRLKKLAKIPTFTTIL